ncbi:MAG TPA: FG-GAP-like repeat-containing protein, partial [Candidatus Eisenbacteria bacterium]|nr:FG-GAP-like repeat-containing protein [Candidatus Eisenbacteria bacterium]
MSAAHGLLAVTRLTLYEAFRKRILMATLIAGAGFLTLYGLGLHFMVLGEAGGMALVTAPFYSTGVSTGGGRAYVYLGSETGLGSGYTWSVLRSPANCAYGWSAATAGDVNGDGFADIAVGAPWDENGQTNEGIVYVYPGSSSFISNLNSWSESNQVSAQMGVAVSSAGDVNGDGYADMILGAPFFDDGEADEGRAFLYIGSATGLISTAWLAEGNQAAAQFGAAVSTAGDVNGDGYDDVMVGAPNFDTTLTDEGKAFLYLGGAGGLAASPAWTTVGGIVGASHGASVSTAGDVNGDGYADVIVGAPQLTPGLGFATAFLGSATGLAPSPSWIVQSSQSGAQFGKSVDSAGDVNGDGFADVIIGAPFHDSLTTDAGRALVYLGSASGLATTPTWTKDGSEFGGRLGWSVSGAGDTNGDGYADVIVGTPFAFTAHVDVYLGYNLGVLTTAAFTAPATGTSQQSQWGLSVAGVGDINGDGFADVAVGSPWFDQDQSENKYGWAYVYYGSATGLNVNFGSAMTSSPQLPNDRFGFSVAGAGDINGDGYADFVVGAPSYSNGQASEGRAFVYMGGGAEGLALRPRQRTSDGTRAISRGLASDSGTSFRLGAL